MMLSVRNQNLLLVGLFLLIWSSTSQILFGETVKLVLLIAGFCLVLLVTIVIPGVRKVQIPFVVTTCLAYFLIILIGYVQQQDVFTAQNILFGLVCLGLANAGYALAKVSPRNVELNEALPAFCSILTVVTAALFIREQQTLSVDERGLAFELNPVGLAYIESLLLILLTFIFFKSKVMLNKLLCLTSIVATIIVIVSTLSRGALLYLFLLGVLLIHKYIFTHTAAGFLVKAIPVVILLLVSLSLLTEKLPLIESKKQALIQRIEKLDSYFAADSGVIDRSADVRKSFYVTFFEQWNDYTLGKYRYKPYPHNQFLEIYSRWGVFGIPLLFFSLFTLSKSIKMFILYRVGDVPFVMLVNSFFVFSYMQSMTSLSLEMNRIMWLGFGFVYAVSIAKPEARSGEPEPRI